MEDKINDSLNNLRNYLKNMTKEQEAEMREHFRDKRPKGWLSIEEHVPMMLIKDISEGSSKIKVKYQDGTEGFSYVSDGHIWYHRAKDEGITHWFNE